MRESQGKVQLTRKSVDFVLILMKTPCVHGRYSVFSHEDTSRMNTRARISHEQISDKSRCTSIHHFIRHSARAHSLKHGRCVDVGIKHDRDSKHIERSIEIEIAPTRLGRRSDVPKRLAPRARVNRTETCDAHGRKWLTLF